MLEFQLVQQVKILFGAGSVKQVGELMQQLNLHKAMIVCDEGVVKTGMAARVVESLESHGCEHFVYDKVLADPPSYVVDEGIAAYKQNACDAIIAIGGGSSIDTAKGINILRFNEGPILRYTDFSTPMEHSGGLIAIPTTAGTGSEMSDGLVITNLEHIKCPILASKAMVEYAVVDPELMAGMPPHLTASTGFDALSHALESYTSSVANAMSDHICKANIDALIRWLPVAVEDGANIEARTQVAVCCSMAGWMLCYGHTHAGHSVAHILGAEFGIPHGFACAYAEPWVVEFNAPAIPEKTKKIGEALGVCFSGQETPAQIGAATRDALIRFRDEKLHLRKATEFQHDTAKFEEMAKEISDEMFQAFNPCKMEPSDALQLLQKIFS